MNKLFLVLIGLVVLVGFVGAADESKLVNEVGESEDEALDGGIYDKVGGELSERIAYDPSQRGVGLLEQKKEPVCKSSNKSMDVCRTCCEKNLMAHHFTKKGPFLGKCTCYVRNLV